MTTNATIQRRVRLTPDQWAIVDAAAAMRGIQASDLLAEAVYALISPLARIEQAAAVIDNMASERADLAAKIDLLFSAQFSRE